jgi:hypothetical protein
MDDEGILEADQIHEVVMENSLALHPDMSGLVAAKEAPIFRGSGGMRGTALIETRPRSIFIISLLWAA